MCIQICSHVYTYCPLQGRSDDDPPPPPPPRQGVVQWWTLHSCGVHWWTLPTAHSKGGLVDPPRQGGPRVDQPSQGDVHWGYPIHSRGGFLVDQPLEGISSGWHSAPGVGRWWTPHSGEGHMGVAAVVLFLFAYMYTHSVYIDICTSVRT